MKHDAWRQSPGAHQPVPGVAARWSDVDTRRHVNNIAVAGLHQEARWRGLQQALGGAVGPGGSALIRPRHSCTEFWRECRYPQPLQAGLRAGPLQAQALPLASTLWQDCLALGAQRSLLAAWSPDGRQRLPWPAELQAATARWCAGHQALPHTAAPGPGSGTGDGDGDGDGLNPLSDGAGEPRCYPVHAEMPSRYGDLDADGCSSELALLRAIEQARAATLQAAWRAAGGVPERDWVTLVVARIDLHIAHHAAPPPQWVLAGAVRHIGRSSCVLRVALFGPDDATLQAMADCVMVYTRPGDGAVAPLPEPLRAALPSLAWRAP